MLVLPSSLEILAHIYYEGIHNEGKAIDIPFNYQFWHYVDPRLSGLPIAYSKKYADQELNCMENISTIICNEFKYIHFWCEEFSNLNMNKIFEINISLKELEKAPPVNLIETPQEAKRRRYEERWESSYYQKTVFKITRYIEKYIKDLYETINFVDDDEFVIAKLLEVLNHTNLGAYIDKPKHIDLKLIEDSFRYTGIHPLGLMLFFEEKGFIEIKDFRLNTYAGKTDKSKVLEPIISKEISFNIEERILQNYNFSLKNKKMLSEIEVLKIQSKILLKDSQSNDIPLQPPNGELTEAIANSLLVIATPEDKSEPIYEIKLESVAARISGLYVYEYGGEKKLVCPDPILTINTGDYTGLLLKKIIESGSEFKSNKIDIEKTIDGIVTIHDFEPIEEAKGDGYKIIKNLKEKQYLDMNCKITKKYDPSDNDLELDLVEPLKKYISKINKILQTIIDISSVVNLKIRTQQNILITIGFKNDLVRLFINKSKNNNEKTIILNKVITSSIILEKGFSEDNLIAIFEKAINEIKVFKRAANTANYIKTLRIKDLVSCGINNSKARTLLKEFNGSIISEKNFLINEEYDHKKLQEILVAKKAEDKFTQIVEMLDSKIKATKDKIIEISPTNSTE